MSAQRLVVVTVLAFPLAFGCSDDASQDTPMFTSGDASDGSGTADDESGGNDMNGDGDGDSTGDGDGEPTGDGDGEPTGDGDGEPTGDGDGEPGCDSDPSLVGASCGQNAGIKGAVAFGETMDDLPVGGISALDNGPGNGGEDWYRIDFPLDNDNPRPLAGMPTISFALNQGGDYRFEVYRDCGAQVYGQGLAAEFGSNAPPLLEWSFSDLDPGGLEQVDYLENVLWPTSVWVRVIRSQNANACSNYQLQVSR
ncbi:MAG: hypothetical protein R6X02_04560 [Enhygromyxa sp.]